MRILIADDDPIATRLLEASLRASGHEVMVATDGTQAWILLQSDDPPRIAILDWMMPGLDGLQVCRNVRRAGGPYVYLLLLTANTNLEEVVAGINAGADDYIKKPFSPEELRARLRAGMRIVNLEEKLRLQATYDALTGVLTRTIVMEGLEAELQRTIREATILSVAMVDLDDFKRVNDTYGHVAGDAVLRETAAKMRLMLRPYDLIGRYGGEEFIIVFPQCDVSKAAIIAERLRAFISSKPVDIGAGKVLVTASIGLADTTTLKDSDSLIRAADAALLRAKSKGRDRVETSPASNES